VRETEKQAIVWRPEDSAVQASNLRKFMDLHEIADYDQLLLKSSQEPEWFWDTIIKHFGLQFYKPYTKVLDSSKGIPWTEWCVGGQTNVVQNCLDRHMDTPKQDETAIVWEGEGSIVRRWTYGDLNAETCRLAEGLRALGCKRGDVIGLFLPMIPEAAAAYLAIAKIGAIVLPLFSGFGASAIASRLNDAGAVAVFTADGTMRRGKPSSLKATLDLALREVPTLHSVIIAQSVGVDVDLVPGRDHWWQDVCAGQPDISPTERLDADAPLMLVYTSGTTGKPKGTIHTHCGFPTKLALDMGLCMDFKASDRILWMSDMGWVVGPILVVATTLLGGSMLLVEGAPNYPNEGRMWQLIDDHKITFLGIAPTIIRSFMASGGGNIEDYDLSSLRVSVSTGETWTYDAWMWMFENVCKKKVPILNYSGGTEIGGGILTGTMIHPLKPCSFSGPVPGMGADIVGDDGNPVAPGEVGELVLRVPSIGLTRGLWNDSQRYIESYWDTFPGLWRHGDWASTDQDGFWYIHGRSDDTLKIAGKRTGPSEIEALVTETGKIREVAVIGVPDKVKGEAVVCVCVPMPGVTPGHELEEEISNAIVSGLGVPFRPQKTVFVSDLPKTRTMKIMRRVVRAVYLGKPAGDLSSLVNPEAVEEIARLAASSQDS
jgi:acetyl-CoA synthetase